jgi:Tfp pilus assembly protein PilX
VRYRIQRPRPHRGERGIALIAALLVVLLTSVLAATFMAMTTGERAVSNNTHIARGALLSADAGVRVAQQQMANMAQAKMDSLALIWPGSGAIIASPTTLFPAGATVVSSTNPPFNSSATISFTNDTLLTGTQTYNYYFTIVSTGTYGQLGGRKVQSQGILRCSASRGSFTDFLTFTQNQTMIGGGKIWFTSSSSFDGRVHTNGEFAFAFKPTFQDLITSVNSNAWFNNNGSQIELAASNNGTVDVPQLYGGFNRGVPSVSLPADSYSQANAALGYAAGVTTPPTNTQIDAAIGVGGSGSPPSGIYLPNSGGALTGGIYVQGNLDQCLCRVDGSGNQVYVLTQGGTVKTVTVNLSANTTTIQINSGSPTTYTGNPRGIIYTAGQVSDLRGPDRVSGTPPAAIASSNQLMIAATGDIVVQRDVTYQDYNAGQNVLGLFSSGGAIRVGSSAPNDMNLDAFVMASDPSNGEFAVDSYNNGSPRGTFHLRGGLVESYYGPFFTFNSSGTLQTGYARDYHYDRRGFDPPYYPLTNLFQADEPTARTMSWKEL